MLLLCWMKPKLSGSIKKWCKFLRKVFHKSRYRHHWYRIAVDGTGVVSFDYPHCEQCLHQTSKNDKTTYSHKVLNARLITPNGFSISVASEWIENPEHEAYDKQDCERKAFKRLAAKLKDLSQASHYYFGRRALPLRGLFYYLQSQSMGLFGYF